MPQDPWNDHNAHLKDMPDQVLFDVARNESAQRPYRRHAVEILVTRKSPRVKHPDLQDLVKELEIELDGIQFEYPAAQGVGPLVASVTTDSMFGEPIWPTPDPISASVEFHADQIPATLPENSGIVLVVTEPSTEKETDARQDDSSIRSPARADDAEQKFAVPGEQKPAARRNRNKASAPASKTV